jgi:hypothetical protein
MVEVVMTTTRRNWLLAAVLPSLAAAAPDDAVKVKQWDVWEGSLTASKAYAPAVGLDAPMVSAAFVHSGTGARLDVEGFWDGGRVWRFRFAPVKAGEWRWKTASPDSGLDGKRGLLHVSTPTREDVTRNPNYRGHVRVAPGDRYFVYADGTPFLLLGDTLWSMNTRRCGFDEQGRGPFQTWLSDRKHKLFNTVFTEYFEPNQENEGGFPFPGEEGGLDSLRALNPAYFRALDWRMRALWEAGFVVAAHPTWAGKQIGSQPEAIRLATRYLLARYGAYNLIWSLSGEYQYSYTNTRASWRTEDWNRLGRDVEQWNPYRHPVSIHPSGRQGKRADRRWPEASAHASSGGEFHGASWLDHNWLQTGHGIQYLPLIPERIDENRDRVPARPVIESEGYYENHTKEGATRSQVRWQAWVSFLRGAAGYAYGASAVWQFFDPNDAACCGVDRLNSRPWNGHSAIEALQYPGSEDMRRLRLFLEEVEWWTLRPGQDLVRLEGAADEPDPLRRLHCAANPGHRYVVYVPEGNGGKRLGLLLDGAAIRAVWFNPRDGTRVDVSESARRAGARRGWLSPPVPDENDWVLSLAAR